MFFVSPETRYAYHTPKGRRQAKSGKFTAPFPSMWYSHLGNDSRLTSAAAGSAQVTVQTLHNLYASLSSGSSSGSGSARKIHFSTSQDMLPLGVLPETDPRKKRERNDRKREKHKQRKLLKGGAG